MISCVSQNQIRTPTYRITLSEDKKAIFIAGTFNHGIYNDVLDLFESNKDTVESLVYQSLGGYVNESEYLYELAKNNKLSTYAIEFCNSACTIAYLGGQPRLASRSAKFGFHQINHFTKDGTEHTDNDKAVQNNILKKFDAQNIEKSFSNKTYKTKQPDYWFPSNLELTVSNFVTAFIFESQMPYFDFKNEDLYAPSYELINKFN